jgi:hypothetical protein
MQLHVYVYLFTLKHITVPTYSSTHLYMLYAICLVIPRCAPSKYIPDDHRIGFEAGKSDGLEADIADNCNDVHAPEDNQTSCVNGVVAGYDTTYHIGIAKVRYGSCAGVIYNSIRITIIQ